MIAFRNSRSREIFVRTAENRGTEKDREKGRKSELERARAREKEEWREHVTVDRAMRKWESVRDRLENSDSKSGKGVSHGFHGVS